jgi:phosphodiesterase/alkaline phosphatase D-like protein
MRSSPDTPTSRSDRRRASGVGLRAAVLVPLVLLVAAFLLPIPASAAAAGEPIVVTGKASAVTKITAMLNATVNPNGAEVTKCEFEYGLTTAPYEKSMSCSSLPPGSGNSPIAVSAALTGLTPNTEYHVRISATNGAGGPIKGSDETFKTMPNHPAVVTVSASEVKQTTATLHATVNPEGGTLSKCEFEYGPTIPYNEASAPCNPAKPTGTSAVPVSASITGLAPNTEYHFKIIATNPGGRSEGAELPLTTQPAPTVVTEKASSVVQTTATLNAMVNPNGVEVGECKFEYGKTTGYEEPPVPCAPKPGSGTIPVPVSAGLTKLAPNTTYHFRIVANNGAPSTGSDATFITLPNPPKVGIEEASKITQTTATLKTTVNPEGGVVTQCEFEYGPTNAYGLHASCTAQGPLSGTSPVPVSATLEGATPNTTYFFRISATNAGGTSKGEGATFKTPPAGSSEAPIVVGPGPLNLVPPPHTGLPAPVLGSVANIAYVTGRVSVRVPGTRGFVALTGARQLPFRTIIDATHGEVSVTTAAPGGGTQSGEFFDGQFMLTQAGNGTVLATLSGGDFAACRRPRASSRRAAATHLARRLWAMASGSFSTRGNYAAGAVRGAQWLTEDTCVSTLILTTRERVEVTDLVRHRHILERAGQIYIAQAH